jgi:hypothetical protein
MENFTMEVWKGEWSLASTICTTWLSGFMDGTNDAQHTCRWVKCPESYLPEPMKSKADFNRSKENLTPYGLHSKKPGELPFKKHIQVKSGNCTDDSYNFFNLEETRKLA